MYVNEPIASAHAAYVMGGAAGSPASDSAESATTAAAVRQVVPVARRHSKGAAACQVPGCLEALAQPHSKAHRICMAHRNASTIAAPGGPLRFCQQCNVLQPLYDFSGARRSCQRSLQRRRERRQRYRQLQQQQQQQAQRKQGGGAAAAGSGSSADDSEAAAAGTHSDCSQEPEGWLTHSEAAQDSITRQASANLPPQLPMTAIVLTVPAASAAAAPALPATDFRPAAADWQLAGWPHMMQPAEVPYSTHQAAPPPPQQGAHTPLPPPAQLPAKQLPSWTPEAEQQAGLVSAQPSFASMQRQPPQQWQQPGPHLLASSPLPPQEQLPLWLQQPGQVQFAHMARWGQRAQQLQLAPDGQWETVYSVPAPQHGQPMGAPVTVLHPEQLLAGAAQLQQQQVGMQQLQQAQQAQHAQQGQQAQPCMLVWQHSAPLAQLEQLEPHPALQHCSRAPSLPAAMGFASPVHQQGLTHSHSCPSLLASLEMAAEAIPSENELLQLSCELGLL